MFSVKPTEGFIDDDVDGLSEEMTQSDFIRMLDEDRGTFIIDDITEQLRDEFNIEISDHDFDEQAKQVLRDIARRNHQGHSRKLKLRDFI